MPPPVTVQKLEASISQPEAGITESTADGYSQVLPQQVIKEILHLVLRILLRGTLRRQRRGLDDIIFFRGLARAHGNA